MSGARSLFADGFWRNNAAFVQLLGLCPLLAITTTLVNGLALGIATTLVLIATNSVVSLVRGALVPSVRILIFVLIIASLVTTVDMLTNAFFHDLYRVLGLFIPLIITNCAILAQAESMASRHRIDRAALSGLATGLGFAAALVLLGGLREIVGSGTLFSGMQFLFGEAARDMYVDLPNDGMLAAILPPGAFFGLAALIALRNFLTTGETAVPVRRSETEAPT
ncbi:MAG: electron transport complex subunit E [Rhodospirillaceae bacterium]|nr:electron transport complex subunit E [Rhodospirillaceae bacterium]